MPTPLQTQGSPRWRALIYSAGSNDLASLQQRDLEQLAQQTDLPENVDIFVQQYTAEGTAKRYRLDHRGRETEHKEMPGNSGTADGLKDFLQYAAQRSPEAERTLLVLCGHGEGHRGTAIDTPHDDRLTLEELRQATTGQGVDTLMFDSCLMGSLEVAAGLAGSVPFMVASQDVVRTGTPLSGYLKAASQSEDGGELAQRLAQQRPTGFPTISAIDTEAASKVKQPLTSLASELVQLDDESFHALYRSNRRGLHGKGNILMGYMTYPGDRVDVGDLCHDILADSKHSKPLRDSATALLETLKPAITRHDSNKPEDGSTGLTLSLPLYRDSEAPEENPFWKETGWDKVQARFQTYDPEKAAGPSLTELLKLQPSLG